MAPAATAAPLETRPLTQALGAEVLGVDLSRPLDAATSRAMHDAFLRHRVLLFRDQEVPPARQVELARGFGEVQVHVLSQYHADGHPELYFLSNLDEQGRPTGRHPDRGTMEWHTDGSWQRVTGHATVIYSVVVPEEGGETWFCDMYGAYDRLSDAWKARLEGLRAVHNLDFSRTRRHGEDPMTEEQKRDRPPVDHPIVRTHPETGRRCIFLGDHAEHVLGMDYDEGRALVEELNALAVHEDLTYRHRWRPRELIVWDNRCLLHRATPFDTARDRRVMRRCTVLGEVPT